jgi:hypothetical protein
MTTCFAIVNQSTTSPLSTNLTPVWLTGLAVALQAQLNRDLAPFWGGSYVVRISDGTDIAAGEAALLLQDSGPPSALGWHDIDGNDVVFGVVDVDLESSLDDLAQTCSHEILEMAVDGPVNTWRDNGAGVEVAQEACDAVESNRYPDPYVTNGQAYALSDFVLPTFFDPNAQAPYCFLHYQQLTGTDLSAASIQGFPSAPFATAAGGYQNVRQSTNGVVQVFGEAGRNAPPTGRRGKRAYEGKHAAYSRAGKIGVRSTEQPGSPEAFKAAAV